MSFANYDEQYYLSAGGLNTESPSMETQKVQLREKLNQKIAKEKMLKELDETQITCDNSSDKSSDDEEEDDFDDKQESQTSSIVSSVNIIGVDSCVSNVKAHVVTRYLKSGIFYL